MESLFRNEVWGHLQAPVSEPNENSVFASMIDGCRSVLDHALPAQALALAAHLPVTGMVL